MPYRYSAGIHELPSSPHATHTRHWYISMPHLHPPSLLASIVLPPVDQIVDVSRIRDMTNLGRTSMIETINRATVMPSVSSGHGLATGRCGACDKARRGGGRTAETSSLLRSAAASEPDLVNLCNDVGCSQLRTAGTLTTGSGYVPVARAGHVW